jgi:hypothetical protein
MPRSLGLAVVNAIAIYSNTSPSQCNEEKLLRLSEVKQHNNIASGVWIIYNGGVYDVTSFVPNHPGGPANIMLAAGLLINQPSKMHI